MQEPPSTSPTPTTRSDVDHGDDDEDINLSAPPAKRRAVQSPASVSRPYKVARLNDHDQRERSERRPQASSDKRTNVAAPSSLTQAPNVAKKPRPSFLSQPTSVPPARPAKGKDRVSSRQSTSSLSDHISNMVEKHNGRYRRVETARKTTRRRRVTTAALMRDVQRSSSKFILLILCVGVLTSVRFIKAALKFHLLPLVCEEVSPTTFLLAPLLDSFT